MISKQDDMVFFNNHRVLHGRTGFEDYEDSKLKTVYDQNLDKR